jgi:hypothetical protein
VGDFNRDGNLDLAVTNDGSNNVSVLLGNGNGGFGTATNFPADMNPDSVAVGDFNRDGNLDLAIANFGSRNVSVLLGNGNGGFGTATNFQVDLYPLGVAVSDFNRDGSPDLVTANHYGSTSVLLNTCGAGVATATPTGNTTSTRTSTPIGTPTATPTCSPGWVVVSSPNVGTDSNVLGGVAVVSSSDVWAVGVTETAL